MPSSIRCTICLLLFHSFLRCQRGHAEDAVVRNGPCDDISFSICSTKLSNALGDKQNFYDEFMEGCRVAAKAEGANPALACDSSDGARRKMNRYQPSGMVNFTKTGFAKVKTPPEVFKLIRDFWELNKDEAVVEWDHHTPYHNAWESPPTMARIHNASLPTGGGVLQRAISTAAKTLMEEWTGMRLSYSSVYGIRSYPRNSVLSPHVDRNPLVSSAIINVAQDVEEDWPLEVFDHDGVAHNVTMEPGDMILYESHSVIHGRPFPLKGNYFANCFVHFEPLAPLDQNEDIDNDDLPPYVAKNGAWEREFRKENPDGWNRLLDPCKLIYEDDFPNLRRVAKVRPDLLTVKDEKKWEPIHEAARSGRLDMFKFLVEQGVDYRAVTIVKGGKDAVGIAEVFFGKDNAISKYVAELEAEDEEF